MKKAQIYCIVPKGADGLNFYLNYDGTSYFLFNQRYRSNAEVYFKTGVPLELALKAVKRGTPENIRNISDKLPSYIRYIEKEYNIQVLDKTNKNMKKRRVANA